jgi:hypothetical protein
VATLLRRNVDSCLRHSYHDWHAQLKAFKVEEQRLISNKLFDCGCGTVAMQIGIETDKLGILEFITAIAAASAVKEWYKSLNEMAKLHERWTLVETELGAGNHIECSL